MALRAVPDHPKFARLKVLLRTNKSGALGYLEGLWHFCGRYTPTGALGKYSDGDIEAWLEWDGEEGALIAAYVKAGWVDVHPEHRLVVHDWHQHADDATRKAVSRAKAQFVGLCPDTVETAATEIAKVRMLSDSVGTPAEEITKVRTLSGLPEPVPEPEPVPVPVPVQKEPSQPSQGRASKSVASQEETLPPDNTEANLKRAVLEEKLDALIGAPRKPPLHDGLESIGLVIARQAPTSPLIHQARSFLQLLHDEFFNRAQAPPGNRSNWEDPRTAWNRCFEHVRVADCEVMDTTPLVVLETPKPRDLADGLNRYAKTVTVAMKKAFGREVQLRPRLEAA